MKLRDIVEAKLEEAVKFGHNFGDHPLTHAAYCALNDPTEHPKASDVIHKDHRADWAKSERLLQKAGHTVASVKKAASKWADHHAENTFSDNFKTDRHAEMDASKKSNFPIHTVDVAVAGNPEHHRVEGIKRKQAEWHKQNG